MKRLLPLVLLAGALALSGLASASNPADHGGAPHLHRVANLPSATAPGGRFEGVVAAIGTSTIAVVSKRLALVLDVPTGSDLAGVAAGDEVEATFAQQPDGTLTLTALSLGDDEQGDDDGGGRDGHGDGGRH